MVFDHQTFWLDLEAAKADLEANVTTGYRVDVSFRPEYTARQALEGKPPSPKNWAEYVRKMSENKALFAKVLFTAEYKTRVAYFFRTKFPWGWPYFDRVSNFFCDIFPIRLLIMTESLILFFAF